VTLYNCSVSDSLHADLNLTYNSTLTMINCTYASYNDSGGLLYWGNWLMVQAVFESNGTPIPGVDIMVTDNDMPVYATQKYVGTDPKTNALGYIGPVPVVASTSSYGCMPAINVTKINSKYEHSLSSSYGQKNKNLENIDMSINRVVQLVFDVTGPGPVTNLQATALSGTEINISWIPPVDVDLKNVRIFKKTGVDWNQIGSNKTNQDFFIAKGLSDKTFYEFQLIAIDWEDLPNPSEAKYVNATTWDITAPAKPENLTAKLVEGGAVTIQWSTNTETDLDGYYLFCSNPVSGGWKAAVTVDATTTEHAFTGLTSETDYSFYIEAFDDWAPVPNNSTMSDILMATTLDITSPEAPSISLPNNTNKDVLRIKGQLKDKTPNGTKKDDLLSIIIHNDRTGFSNTSTAAGGIFDRNISLMQGNNVINVFARDVSNNEGSNFTKTVYCDSIAPVAVSQGNLDIFTGETVNLDSNGSEDNVGITEYIWTFIYDNATVTLTGALGEFTFDLAHHYLVTLTVRDLLGNEDITSFWINVTVEFIPEPDITPPSMLDTTPADQGYDINISTEISILFDEYLNIWNTTITLHEGISQVPGTTDVSGVSVTFTPTTDLEYNTTYVVNVTAEDMAGNLFTTEWEFTTELDPYEPPITTEDGNETDDDGLTTETLVTIVIVIIIIIVVLVVLIVLIRKTMTEKDLIHDEVRVDEEEEVGWACPECGTALSEGITYCYECGAEFTEEEAMEAGGVKEDEVEDVDEEDIEDDEDEEEVEDVDEEDLEDEDVEE
jgi:hypothetical protein